ncbi:glutamate--cysteine ligase [Algoriphagus alkaliphilus]|uniref:glutamate--cysteine ligase n=1 Tax=Algoriphagus alkaliphilus TaxID=279824 RepID=A0A1G5XG80_9BACT|nr:glutamate-cysteine ligase family protein [Algoriphagus alkaliphilus]SDA69441.1 glutamate--cysteine ligase [Algoriphagus alkaliphilus]
MKIEKLTLDGCRNFLAQTLFEPKTDSGASQKNSDKIGVELEAFPVRFTDYEKTKAIPIPLKGEKLSLHQELEKASALMDGKVDFSNNGSLAPIRFPNGSLFQYEPGGQLEIATSPCKTLPELIAQLRLQQDILDRITSEHQIYFSQLGTNPWFDLTQIGLQLDKPRYRALQEYFSRLGPYGVQMMRQTCSLHVNLDLGLAESTQVKRIVAANLLAPFATAIFANSGILEGKITTRKSHRSYLWQQLDSSRTGVRGLEPFDGLPEKSQLIETYLDFAMKAPILHIRALGDRVFPVDFTFDYWLKNPIAGLSPSWDDLENHLSLLYPEVRIKGFLEIRTADALPREWQLVPAFFYTGLLYSNDSLEKVLELLLPFQKEINAIWEKSSFGFESNEIFGISGKLMKLALDGMAGFEEEFACKDSKLNLENYYNTFTSQRKSVAEATVARFLEGKSLIY